MKREVNITINSLFEKLEVRSSEDIKDIDKKVVEAFIKILDIEQPYQCPVEKKVLDYLLKNHTVISFQSFLESCGQSSIYLDKDILSTQAFAIYSKIAYKCHRHFSHTLELNIQNHIDLTKDGNLFQEFQKVLLKSYKNHLAIYASHSNLDKK